MSKEGKIILAVVGAFMIVFLMIWISLSLHILRNLRQLEPDGKGWHGEGVTVYENAVCHAPGFEATLLIPVFGFVIISGVTSS
jgi:hypothetical protein